MNSSAARAVGSRPECPISICFDTTGASAPSLLLQLPTRLKARVGIAAAVVVSARCYCCYCCNYCSVRSAVAAGRRLCGGVGAGGSGKQQRWGWRQGADAARRGARPLGSSSGQGQGQGGTEGGGCPMCATRCASPRPPALGVRRSPRSQSVPSFAFVRDSRVQRRWRRSRFPRRCTLCPRPRVPLNPICAPDCASNYVSPCRPSAPWGSLSCPEPRRLRRLPELQLDQR